MSKQELEQAALEEDQAMFRAGEAMEEAHFLTVWSAPIPGWSAQISEEGNGRSQEWRLGGSGG